MCFFSASSQSIPPEHQKSGLVAIMAEASDAWSSANRVHVTHHLLIALHIRWKYQTNISIKFYFHLWQKVDRIRIRCAWYFSPCNITSIYICKHTCSIECNSTLTALHLRYFTACLFDGVLQCSCLRSHFNVMSLSFRFQSA